jgi:hypothetical protein
MNHDAQLFLESLVKKALANASFDAGTIMESKSISLLLEEVTEEEQKDLATLTGQTRKALEALNDLVPGQMKITKKFIRDLSGEVPSEADIMGLNLRGDKRKIATKVSEAAVAIDKVSSASISISKALATLATEFANSSYVQSVVAGTAGADVKMQFERLPLEQFLEEYGEGNLASKKDIGIAIGKAYVAPKPARGFFKKIARAIGFELMPPSLKQIASDFMDTPLSELINLREKAEGFVQSMQGIETRSEEVVSDATEDVADYTDQDPAEGGEGEDEAPAGGLPTLSSLLFEPIDPEDVSKGTKIKGDINDPGTIPNKLGIAMRNVADSSLRSSWEGLVDKPNAANRESFISNLKNLKDELNKVTVEKKDKQGQVLLERWQNMAGLDE